MAGCEHCGVYGGTHICDRRDRDIVGLRKLNAELLKCLKIQADKIESLKKAIEIKPLSEILGEDE